MRATIDVNYLLQKNSNCRVFFVYDGNVNETNTEHKQWTRSEVKWDRLTALTFLVAKRQYGEFFFRRLPRERVHFWRSGELVLRQ